MKLFAVLHRWFRGRELSRVEVVKALFALDVIRPEKPKPQRPKIRSYGAWVRYQEQEKVA